MAVSIFDENIMDFATEFTPFDDSNDARVNRAATQTVLATSSIDTREYDAFRQGINISTETYRFKGSGAKIWAGNIHGYTTVRTFGQTISFTEFFNNKSFYDRPDFDPTLYLELGPNYPKPIEFNDGPQQNKECILMPLTIPFRKGLDDNEGPEYVHAVRASLEDGNTVVDQINDFSNRIQQLIEYKVQDEPWPFLDEGQQYFGNGYGYISGSVTGSIIVDGYLDFVERKIEPFDDTSDQILVKRLTLGLETMISAANELHGFNLDMDIRENREHKSANAGFYVYGPEQGRTGTDSIVYLGTMRGS